MRNFKALIHTESRKLLQLHRTVHETFKARDSNKANYEAWQEACRQFHSYESALDEWVDQCLAGSDLSGADAVEFCLQFLETDPFFFRSGYIKEDLISRLKRTVLREADRARVKQICITAVQLNGRREYRRYCRLAGCVYSEELNQELEQLSRSENGSIRSRAKLMLQSLFTTRKTNSGAKQ